MYLSYNQNHLIASTGGGVHASASWGRHAFTGIGNVEKSGAGLAAVLFTGLWNIKPVGDLIYCFFVDGEKLFLILAAWYPIWNVRRQPSISYIKLPLPLPSTRRNGDSVPKNKNGIISPGAKTGTLSPNCKNGDGMFREHTLLVGTWSFAGFGDFTKLKEVTLCINLNARTQVDVL